MKIGIFGDSFAVKIPENPTLSWMDIVAQQHDVTNFARSGSSLYYSYKKYLEHQNEFDKIIFVLTGPGRLYVASENRFEYHIPNFGHAEFSHTKNFLKKEQTNTVENYNFLIHQAASDYYKYLFNVDEHNLYYEFMWESLKKNPNVLLLYTANYPLGEEKTNWPIEHSLGRANNKDFKFYQLDRLDPKIRDLRHCHMNELNNRILGNEVLHYLATGEFRLSELNWQTDSIDKKSFYFSIID